MESTELHRPNVESPLANALAYGALGLPLAFAALPIYVHLPRLYGEFLAIPLAVLGAVLLFARLGDALIDPWLGHFSDRWRAARPVDGRRELIALTLPPFVLGLWLLLNPPGGAGVLWLSACLSLTYVCFSLLTITYQAWGAELTAVPQAGAAPGALSRLTASREGFGLIGVILAASLPGFLASDLPQGLSHLATLFVPLTIACALLALLGATAEASAPSRERASQPPVAFGPALKTTWRDSGFRRLLMVFLLSGIAAALPATLVMFYVADVLRAADSAGPLLALYFVAGLGGLPLWVRWARHRGQLGAWRDAMWLACIAFVGAPFLGAGDLPAFAVMCVLSGLALGADLILPATWLAERARHAPATYFGVWNFAGKLNLALAAGLALPLLALAGYAPGDTTPDNNLAALAWLYGGLPLAFKATASVLLHRWLKDMEPKS